MTYLHNALPKAPYTLYKLPISLSLAVCVSLCASVVEAFEVCIIERTRCVYPSMEELEEDAMETEPTSINTDGPEGIAGSGEKMVDGKTEPEVPEHYDPTEDDKNDIWAAKERQGRKSDAVLSCPACFNILCIDCQRHEIYVNQYRAMFVRNCEIVETERLRYPADKKRTRNGRRKRGRQQADAFGDLVRIDINDAGVGEVFKAVQCEKCKANVAVLDRDEVYHFFDVFPTFS